MHDPKPKNSSIFFCSHLIASQLPGIINGLPKGLFWSHKRALWQQSDNYSDCCQPKHPSASFGHPVKKPVSESYTWGIKYVKVRDKQRFGVRGSCRKMSCCFSLSVNLKHCSSSARSASYGSWEAEIFYSWVFSDELDWILSLWVRLLCTCWVHGCIFHLGSTGITCESSLDQLTSAKLIFLRKQHADLYLLFFSIKTPSAPHTLPPPSGTAFFLYFSQ